jgi:hypothetical protein
MWWGSGRTGGEWSETSPFYVKALAKKDHIMYNSVVEQKKQHFSAVPYGV